MYFASLARLSLFLVSRAHCPEPSRRPVLSATCLQSYSLRVALMLLRRPAGYAALWLFNLWGAGDLLFAFYQGLFDEDFHPSALGATFYIPTVYVPLLLCVHFMLFALVLRARSMSTNAAA